jgi:phenylpyruvate tautomerase PptA (4-oxalocrotonate tautomerase family)
MPMIDLTVPPGALSEEHKATLVEELTNLIVKWEEGTQARATATRPGPSSTKPTASRSPAGCGPPARRPLYRVIVSIPKGSLNDDRKAGLVADVTETIMETERREPWKHDPHRVWCIVNDMPDGDLGAGRRILRLRDLVDIFGENLSPERHAEFEFDKR